MLRFSIHYGFHFLIPLVILLLCYRDQWKSLYLYFLAAMLIDLDHLLATPVFDAHRCSINLHPLHTYVAIGVYIALLLSKKTRWLGIGLLWHILTDTIDCFLMELLS